MIISEEQIVALQQRLKAIVSQYDAEKSQTDKDLRKYAETVEKLPEFIEEADREFEQQTHIMRVDVSFLLFAATLQAVRQFATATLKTRLSDKEAARRTPFHMEEHSDRKGKLYYASTDEIVCNPVPFDAVRKTEQVKLNGNPKLNGFNHRYKAIGHDPILGLFFGTANIMTNTITVASGGLLFETYHVGSGIATNGRGEYMMDMLTEQASTTVMFQRMCSRVQQEGTEGWRALGLALGKELVHLLSDVRTAKSLPLPLVSAVAPDVSRILNLCGIDALSIGTFGLDYFLSKLIDMAIAYLHAWCYNPNVDGSYELYSVRTRNIVYYSNLIALASTTLQSIVRSYMGDASAFSKFDFGGSVSALRVIWNTPFMISEVKHEFINNQTVKYLSK